MATITTVSHGSYMQSPRRTYLTTADFNGYIYKLVKTGDVLSGEDFIITPQTGIVAPKGHYLRENGKKIIPGQYLAPDGVTRNQVYYVGVYDDSTFTNGFINPNSKVFIPLNTDKPVTIQDDLATDAKDGTIAQGPPVNTFGYVASGVGSYDNFAVTYTNGGAPNNTNVYIDPIQGNTYLVDPSVEPASGDRVTSGNNVYVYFSDIAGTYIVPPTGSIITVVFKGITTSPENGSYYRVSFIQNTTSNNNVYPKGYLNVYENSYSTITFISDGNGLREISRSSADKSKAITTPLQIVDSGTGTITGTNSASSPISSPYAINGNRIIIQYRSGYSSVLAPSDPSGLNFTVTRTSIPGGGGSTTNFSWFILG